MFLKLSPDMLPSGLQWGLLSQFSLFLYLPIFHSNHNNSYLYDIMFISDRCHRSSAVETPSKYECDWKYLNYTFAKPKFPVTEKLTTRALEPPTPGPATGATWVIQGRCIPEYMTIICIPFVWLVHILVEWIGLVCKSCNDYI